MTEEAGFVNLKTDRPNRSATFEVNRKFDFEAKLKEIVEGGNSHVEGWSLQEEEEESGTTEQVSISLPNMT